MSNINFTIRRIFPGSEAQRKVGIHATFTMTIDGPDGIIVQMDDMKLMQSKDGQYYIASPFRTFDGKDQEGKPKKVRVEYTRLFPEKKNWDKKDAVVKLVLDELANGSSKPAARPASPSVTTPQSDPW